MWHRIVRKWLQSAITQQMCSCELRGWRGIERKKLTLHHKQLVREESREIQEPADEGVSSLHLIIAILWFPILRHCWRPDTILVYGTSKESKQLFHWLRLFIIRDLEKWTKINTYAIVINAHRPTDSFFKSFIVYAAWVEKHQYSIITHICMELERW